MRTTRSRAGLRRRGDAFLLTLDILFLAAMIFLFWKIAGAFTLANPSEPLGSREAAMLRTYDAADDALLYLDVSAQREARAAMREVAKAGGTIAQNSRCGTYAGLQRWTAPGSPAAALECYPDKRLMGAFVAELRSRLRIAPSWIIPPMLYDVAASVDGDGLLVSGRGLNEVTLPILLSRSGDPRAATRILENGGAPSISGAFAPDSPLAAAVRPSAGGLPRSGGAIKTIIVHATGTPDTAGALAVIDRGGAEAQYLIDRDGRITQLVREDLRVRHLPACDDAGVCALQSAEDTSIAIALVLDGPQAAADGACPPGDAGPAAATQWCGWAHYGAPAAGCPAADGAQRCWPAITKAQSDALVNLSADIARRRAIPADAASILLAEQVAYATPEFGPGIVPSGVTIDAHGWWMGLVSSVAARVSAQPSVPDAPRNAAGSASAPQLGIPVAGDGLYVSSCYGYRTVDGRGDKHDGIDFAGDGLRVVAAADGAVIGACMDGKCDAPLGDGDFGNNIVVEHDGGVLTRYSHLREVLVRKGDRVARGQRIGVSGNTGRSTGSHLDFKVYLARNDIPEFGGKTDLAVEPLCFFSSADYGRFSLNTESQSCAPYGAKALTADNAVLRQACSGISVQPTASCGVAATQVTSDDPDIRLTIGRLDSLGVRDELRAQAAKNKVDELLVVAVIAQESKGDPRAVSWTGCAGLGQFCSGTAKSGPFASIFGPGVVTCDCPGEGSCEADAAGCLGDPRLDPHKSVQAIPVHLAADAYGPFGKYTDKWRFAIASYNAGSGNIRSAIRASGNGNPTWEDIVPYLAGTGMGSAKTTEVIAYVRKVSGYWRAIGGDAAPALAGTDCVTPSGTTAQIREVGSYTFTPSFSVRVPNAIAPLAGVSSTVRAIAQRCDGAGGSDPNACFEAGVDAALGDRRVSCVPKNETLRQSLREFAADCAGSDQRGCGCAWDAPPLPEGAKSARLDVYGTDAQLFIDDRATGALPAGPRVARIAALPSLAKQDVVLSIRLTRDAAGETRASLLRWEASGSRAGSDGADDTLRIAQEVPVDQVLLRPDGTWLTGGDVCAPRKREHSVCVDLGSTTRDADGDFVPLVARFAVWLNDKEAPTAPTQAHAALGEGYIGLSFTTPASRDVSHERVWCSPQGTPFDEKKPYLMLAANASRAVLRSCSGDPVLPGMTYFLRIVPYDISGQRGAPLETTTVDQNDRGWAGVLSGLADGFSEEDFLDALVRYYTGGAIGTT